MISKPKILVCGIGALGGVFSFNLLTKGYDCTLVSSNEKITETINKKGIKLTHNGIVNNIQAHIASQLPSNEQFDYIFLMMKTAYLSQALSEIKEKSILKPEGYLLTVQNGDVYREVEELFPNQVVTCIIMWGASMESPGEYVITSTGRTLLGDRNNKINLLELKNILSDIISTPVEVSTNILGAVWSKLCISSTYSIAGISGLTVGAYLKYKKGRELFLAVYGETVELAELQNIKLEKLVSNPYLLYLPKKSNFLKRKIKQFLVKQAGKRFKSVKVSMVQDLERGRKTEIDFLNGYISKLGKEFNYPTPVNDKLVSLIKSIEKKELEPSQDNFSLIDI